MTKPISFLLIFCLTALTGIASLDIYSDISEAFKKSNAKGISKFFSETVEMTILDSENVYSRTQAEQVLRDFLIKNKPLDFKIIHKGASKEGAKYAIGSLKTESGDEYRTYIFVKNISDGDFIQELRIEKE